MGARQVQASCIQEDTDLGAELFQQLVHSDSCAQRGPRAERGIVIGQLVALTNGGATALVAYEGQPDGAALRARSIVVLRGVHIGRAVALMFEGADPLRPVVIGVLQDDLVGVVSESTGQLDIEVDGERLLVRAKTEIVLSCGEASITLAKAGKILIRGTHVRSESTGVNKIHGSSVQIN